MGIESDILRFVELSDAAFPPYAASQPFAEQREYYDDLCRMFARERPEGLDVEDLNGDGVALRLYRPPGVPRPGVLLYCHGGGYVFGGLESHDSICAELAAGSGGAVLAVDYRLAPEHPYPAAVEDAEAALGFLVREAVALGLDPARIAVGGDSAGGCLAAGLALRARDAGGPGLAGQLLIYPDLGLPFDDPRRLTTPDAPGLSRAQMRAFHAAWLGSDHTRDPRAAPLLHRDFGDLAPAYVQAVQYDPLRDDAEVYVERILRDGGQVTFDLQPGLIHGYLRARGMSAAARRGFDALVAALAGMVGHAPVMEAG
jgi:acetyl esterase